MAVGCLTRVVAMLTQVLFALNDTYFITDKGALERIEEFAVRPEGYAAVVREMLGHAGTTRAELEVTAGRLEALHREVGVLCGPWLVGEPWSGRHIDRSGTEALKVSARDVELLASDLVDHV